MGFDLGMLIWAGSILGVLSLVMRWVFAAPNRPRTGRPATGPGADLGLLIPALSGSSRAAALAGKNALAEHGIRCSLSRLDHDRYDVLVFGQDLPAARRVLHIED